MAFSIKVINTGIRALCLSEASGIYRVNVGVSCRSFWTEHAKLKSIVDRIWKDELPKPGNGKAYRRIVHYPEKYTVKPLNVTNLGGRDPVTGRVIVKGIGGGIKHKFHWVHFKREGPKEGPPIEERVIQIMDDGCRTGKIALVARGDELKYYIATENMKAGDIIKTSGYIPRIAVRPNEGDAYPLGALPMGIHVHCVQQYPGLDGHLVLAAGTRATLLRRIGNKVVVQLPSKHELLLHQECMAVVGRVSNVMHSRTPIGSPQRLRELGYRPRSGLWQRKSGRHGRKIKPLPPIRDTDNPRPPAPEPLILTLPDSKIYSKT
ncbi:hypothetical protein L9F63_016178 [Diploptera punctata]|uniref:Mitochondrial ribosomal protein L2 n=1 Tax=Diploptera punctata TaxID=6984 RepID=A0AAD8A2Z5_DIPPU|nr:hypothetical protein L9F63_016178 [Diploptera punctata]